MSILLDGTGGVTTPGVVNTAGETIATTLSVTGATNLAVSSGNVGIGTASPSAKLNVVTSGGNSRISIGDTAVATYSTVLMYGGNGKYNFQLGAQANINNGFEITPSTAAGGTTFSTPAFIVDSSGNVGIGNTAPADRLQIEKANANCLLSVSRTTGGAGGRLVMQHTDSVGALQTTASVPLSFGTNDTERMRIDSSGRFCINNTATIDGSRLSIQMASGDNAVSIRSYDSSTSVMMMQFYTLANTRIGFIQTASGSSTTYSTSSDYRLKESIAPMTGALAKVAQLKPVTYKWKSNGLDSQGFIAHELAEVIPECVTGTKDEIDTDGKPVHQGVDTSFLVATLTAAIQELKAIVDVQAVRIAALES